MGCKDKFKNMGCKEKLKVFISMGCRSSKDIIEITRLEGKLNLKEQEISKLRNHIRNRNEQVLEKDQIILVLLGKSFNKSKQIERISFVQEQIETFKAIVIKKITEIINLLESSQGKDDELKNFLLTKNEEFIKKADTLSNSQIELNVEIEKENKHQTKDLFPHKKTGFELSMELSRRNLVKNTNHSQLDNSPENPLINSRPVSSKKISHCQSPIGTTHKKTYLKISDIKNRFDFQVKLLENDFKNLKEELTKFLLSVTNNENVQKKYGSNGLFEPVPYSFGQNQDGLKVYPIEESWDSHLYDEELLASHRETKLVIKNKQLVWEADEQPFLGTKENSINIIEVRSPRLVRSPNHARSQESSGKKNESMYGQLICLENCSVDSMKTKKVESDRKILGGQLESLGQTNNNTQKNSIKEQNKNLDATQSHIEQEDLTIQKDNLSTNNNTKKTQDTSIPNELNNNNQNNELVTTIQNKSSKRNSFKRLSTNDSSDNKPQSTKLTTRSSKLFYTANENLEDCKEDSDADYYAVHDPIDIQYNQAHGDFEKELDHIEKKCQSVSDSND